MLQSAIVSRIHLLSGTADLLLVILAAWSLQERNQTSWHWAIMAGILVGVVSGLPWLIPLAGYLIVTGTGRLLQRRVWQAPLLAMLTTTFAGSLLINILTLLTLQFSGTPLPWGDTFSLLILPSMLMDLLIAVPVYLLIRDLARLVYPVEDSA
jgi:cell shape-determining protein MreD